MSDKFKQTQKSKTINKPKRKTKPQISSKAKAEDKDILETKTTSKNSANEAKKEHKKTKSNSHKQSSHLNDKTDPLVMEEVLAEKEMIKQAHKKEDPKAIEILEMKEEEMSKELAGAKEQTKPSRNSPVKILLAALGALVLIFILLLGSIFVGSSDRSILGYVLDASGRHKKALQAEVLRKKPLLFAASWGNGNKCDIAWSKETFNLGKAENISGSGEIGLENLKSGNDKLMATAGFAANLDLNKQVAGTDLYLEGKSPLKPIAQAFNPGSDESKNVSSDETLETRAKVKAAISASDINLNFDDIYLKDSQGAVDQSPSKIYGEKTNFTDTQKQGITEGLKEIQEISTWNPVDFIPETEGKKLVGSLCQSFDSLEVGDLEKVTFGVGDNKIEKTLRPIALKLNKDSLSDPNKQKELKDTMNAAIKSDKFKNFFLGKYDNFNRLNRALQKFYGAETYGVKDLDKKDYETTIDEMIKNLTTDGQTQNSSNDSKNSSDMKTLDYLAIKSLSTKVYFDPETMNIYGSTTSLELDPASVAETRKLFTEEDQPLFDLIQGGIKIRGSIYNLNTNSKTTTAEVKAEYTKFGDSSSAPEDVVSPDLQKKLDRLDKVLNPVQPINQDIIKSTVEAAGGSNGQGN